MLLTAEQSLYPAPSFLVFVLFFLRQDLTIIWFGLGIFYVDQAALETQRYPPASASSALEIKIVNYHARP